MDAAEPDRPTEALIQAITDQIMSKLQTGTAS
jgi:hypothetical protein